MCHTPASNQLTPKDKLDYAWKWFEYHASQRLVAYNFLLVLMGALSVAYYTAFRDKEYLYALVAGLFGAFVSCAFLNIDRRNEQLVERGRAALRELEKLPEFSPPKEEDPCRLLTEDHRNKPPVIFSHAWLRWIATALLLLFLVASIVSALKLVESIKASVP
jgi:hypothetical protein